MDRRVAVRAVGCLFLVVAVVASAAWVAAPPHEASKQLVLIVAGPTSESEAFAAGARAAAEKHNVDLRVEIPPRPADAHAQAEIIARIQQARPDGVALCPVRPHEQVAEIDDLSATTQLVLCCADAPSSQRRSYVGVGDYAAGRMGAQAVRDLTPSGGATAVFYDGCQTTHATRLEGLEDSLNECGLSQCSPAWRIAAYPIGHGLTQRATVLRGSIADNPDVTCIVCFSAGLCDATNRVLRELHRNDVKIVAFEPTDDAFAALQSGRIDAVVADNSYQVGYFAVTHLAALCGYDANGLPVAGRGSILIRPEVVTRENLAAFRTGRHTTSSLAVD